MEDSCKPTSPVSHAWEPSHVGAQSRRRYCHHPHLPASLPVSVGSPEFEDISAFHLLLSVRKRGKDVGGRVGVKTWDMLALGGESLFCLVKFQHRVDGQLLGPKSLQLSSLPQHPAQCCPLHTVKWISINKPLLMPTTVLRDPRNTTDLRHANKVLRDLRQDMNAWLCSPTMEMSGGATPLRLTPRNALTCSGKKNRGE